MKLCAKIIVDKDIAKIEKLFLPELKDAKKSRSSYTLVKDEGELVFDIVADDSVALRATLNSITKLLTVYENMKSV